MRLTIWHKGTSKPVRDGVYQRKYTEPQYCKFQSGVWYCYGRDIIEAAEMEADSIMQDVAWRGITKDGK